MHGRLKRIGCLVECCLVVAGFQPGYAAASQTCAPMQVTERGGTSAVRSQTVLLPRITIEKSGRHCLESDVRQESLMDSIRRKAVRAQDEAMIRVRASDATLDMAGHTVSNEMGPGMTIIWFSRFSPEAATPVRPRNVRVTNGGLVSPGPMGVGVDLLAPKTYGKRSLDLAPVPEGANIADAFEETRHMIDTMSIVAGKRGIQMDGRNNVIRNSRIIVDGTTAIVAQGPGTLIENNIIEVHGDLGFMSKVDRDIESTTPYPIRLIQAEGAIIRNNEIRFVGADKSARLTAAIGLVDSNGVLVEDNRFRGFEELVRSDARSSHREVDNRKDLCSPVLLERPVNAQSCAKATR